MSRREKMISIRNESGFSIIELMVAVTIGLIVLVGVGGVFVSSSAAYRTTEGLARLQENGRFAVEFLNREIRMAGYFGCPREPGRIFNNLQHPQDLPARFNVALEGFEAKGTAPGDTYAIPVSDPSPENVAPSNWTPSLPDVLRGRVVQGTDVIVVRAASNEPIRLASPYGTATAVFVEKNNRIAAGQNLVVSDCSKASIFQASAVAADGETTVVSHGAGGNACPNWGTGSSPGCPEDPQKYRYGAELYQAVTTIFYVGRGATGSPALFIAKTGGGGFEHGELVEGIDSMQILYGVDSSSSTTPPQSSLQYMTADQVTEPAKVQSVRVSFIARTVNVSGQADQVLNKSTYDLNGATIDPADDRRHRRVIATAIQLRNQTSTE